MSQTVIGIFEYTNQAQEAKSYLLANGFGNGDVDISTSETTGTSSANSGSTHEEGFGDRISNFFSNLFENEDDAATHSKAGRKGTIVTVHAKTSMEAQEALDVLNNYGAVDVNEYSERSGSSASSLGSESMSGSDRMTGTTENAGAIPVIEEELQVGKREVETGGMRLRSRIVERPVEESIRLREEHVNIERNPVNRPATEADFNSFKEGTVEVREHAERPVVAKEARVVEEVSLDKKVSEREETINDTVRHTEVDTEKIQDTDKTYQSKSNDSSENL